VRGGKRSGAGRKKGSSTVPLTCLAQIFHYIEGERQRAGRSVSHVCDIIMRAGALDFHDRSGKLVYRITDRYTLQSRYFEFRAALKSTKPPTITSMMAMGRDEYGDLLPEEQRRVFIDPGTGRVLARWMGVKETLRATRSRKSHRQSK
jgi:hypothetical protein